MPGEYGSIPWNLDFNIKNKTGQNPGAGIRKESKDAMACFVNIPVFNLYHT